MSHKHEHMICPNCGFHASENFCARCGQPTHLHKETFLGLIVHFIGHYFHYDSKFWQTLKALWFSPGKLTIAYRNNRRMRYLPPISLYIFISVVFFLVSSISPHNTVKVLPTNDADSLANANTNDFGRHFSITRGLSNSPVNITTSEGSNAEREALTEKLVHNIPKVFFFMIPLMAFVLQLLFIRRKELFYVNHVIFALHYHSLWFSIMLLGELYLFEKGSEIAMIVFMLVAAIYFIAALRNVYKIGWLRSVMYSVITAFVYCIFIAFTFTALFFMLR